VYVAFDAKKERKKGGEKENEAKEGKSGPRAGQV